MKNIFSKIFLIPFAFLLVSCTTHPENNQDIWENIAISEATTITATGFSDEAKSDVEAYLRDFEKALKAEWYSELEIVKILEEQKAELTTKIVWE